MYNLIKDFLYEYNIFKSRKDNRKILIPTNYGRRLKHTYAVLQIPISYWDSNKSYLDIKLEIIKAHLFGLYTTQRKTY